MRKANKKLLEHVTAVSKVYKNTIDEASLLSFSGGIGP